MRNGLGLLVLVLTLMGCTPRRQAADDDGNLPFVFRSLNLQQADDKGRPSWKMTSPEARYDLQRRVAEALEPRGVIYRQGDPVYRLSASTATVLNDGELILLEGRIRIEKVGRDPVLITASRVRWFPDRATMDIDRHPRAIDPYNRLVARYARFLIDEKQLELRGSPKLQRWSDRVNPLTHPGRRAPEMVVRATKANWQPDGGELAASGPILATRRSAGARKGRSPQTLIATGLQGNTVEQKYRLKGPVNLQDPAEKADLQAQDLFIDVGAERIRSDQPFRGHRGTLRVAGRSLLLEGSRETVVIPSGCALNRPGESLSARSCSWNWDTQAVRADGSVELLRQSNNQITRGERMRGQLGDQGRIDITAPGSQVFSQFAVPRRSRPSQPAPRRRKREPIRL